MQSDCVFTTPPTPSPTCPLGVPYTSPTSPTNVPRFQTFLQIVTMEASAPNLRPPPHHASRPAPECAISSKQAHRVSVGR